MPPTAPRNNLPPDVVRVLSFHGRVELVVGGEDEIASERVAVAPFEDLLHLLVPAGSRVSQALLDSVACAVQARHPDGEYSLRLTGIGCAGRPLTSHPLRGSLEPWMEEGAVANRLTVVSFAARHVEFTRNEADDSVRYHGPTPLGREPSRPWRSAARAALSGVAGPAAVFAAAVPFAWLVIQGATYPNRILAWVFSAGGGVAAVAGVRLLTLRLAFHRWLGGHAREADAPVLSEALLAPRRAGQAGVALLGVWAVCMAATSIIWDDDLVLLTAFSNAALFWGPAVVGHLMARQPEGRS